MTFGRKLEFGLKIRSSTVVRIADSLELLHYGKLLVVLRGWQGECMNSGIALQRLFLREEHASRSIQNIRLSGELLGLPAEKVEELIDPQDMHVYRLHVPLGETVLPIWGCSVFHNRARGGYAGGVRISPEAGVGQTMELARISTLKSALAEVESGGAKTCIFFDMQDAYRLFEKEAYDREFERGIKRAIMRELARHYHTVLEKHRYLPTPGMGCGPDEMAILYDETKDPASVSGKPEGLPGWLPGGAEAAGYGLFTVIRKGLERHRRGIKGARVMLMGFGSLGQSVAAFLEQEGARLVAVADMGGTFLFDKAGLPVPELTGHMLEIGGLAGFAAAEAVEEDAFFACEGDVLIAAGGSATVTEDHAGAMRAGLVVEGANCALTRKALLRLSGRGVEVIPNLIGGAGGQVAAVLEQKGLSAGAPLEREEVLKIVERKLSNNLDLAWSLAGERKLNLDLACTLLASERLFKAMRSHGWM